jgi:hypothetical protein
MTSWDDLNAIDEPAKASFAHTLWMWSACLAIWMICAPLDLLARPRKGLRTAEDRIGQGGNNNHFGGNI